MTTGSTTTSRITLPIHHKTMACSPRLGLVWFWALAGPALSARAGLVGQEEAAEDPLEREHRGPQPEREPSRRGRRGGLPGGFAALGGVDPGRHVGREVAHQHGGDIGD